MIKAQGHAITIRTRPLWVHVAPTSLPQAHGMVHYSETESKMIGKSDVRGKPTSFEPKYMISSIGGVLLPDAVGTVT
jgi:hypothetical protein